MDDTGCGPSLVDSHTISFIPIKVDHVSVILLLVIFFSPFISAIKKIKIGEFEAEIDPSEVQKIREDISKVAEASKADRVPEAENTVRNIKNLLGADPVLALAKLRMALEKSLNQIYRATRKGEPHDHFVPVGKLAQVLSNEELLPKDVSNTIRQIVSVCNRAMHGEDIRQKDAASVVESGAFLLYELSSYLDEYKYKPTESLEVTPEQIEKCRNGRYRVTTLVPLSESPRKNTYILDQEELDEFLEGYNEYAEFIIAIDRIETADEN